MRELPLEIWFEIIPHLITAQDLGPFLNLALTCRTLYVQLWGNTEIGSTACGIVEKRQSGENTSKQKLSGNNNASALVRTSIADTDYIWAVVFRSLYDDPCSHLHHCREEQAQDWIFGEQPTELDDKELCTCLRKDQILFRKEWDVKVKVIGHGELALLVKPPLFGQSSLREEVNLGNMNHSSDNKVNDQGRKKKYEDCDGSCLKSRSRNLWMMEDKNEKDSDPSEGHDTNHRNSVAETQQRQHQPHQRSQQWSDIIVDTPWTESRSEVVLRWIDLRGAYKDVVRKRTNMFRRLRNRVLFSRTPLTAHIEPREMIDILDCILKIGAQHQFRNLILLAELVPAEFWSYVLSMQEFQRSDPIYDLLKFDHFREGNDHEGHGHVPSSSSPSSSLSSTVMPSSITEAPASPFCDFASDTFPLYQISVLPLVKILSQMVSVGAGRCDTGLEQQTPGGKVSARFRTGLDTTLNNRQSSFQHVINRAFGVNIDAVHPLRLTKLQSEEEDRLLDQEAFSTDHFDGTVRVDVKVKESLSLLANETQRATQTLKLTGNEAKGEFEDARSLMINCWPESAWDPWTIQIFFILLFKNSSATSSTLTHIRRQRMSGTLLSTSQQLTHHDISHHEGPSLPSSPPVWLWPESDPLPTCFNLALEAEKVIAGLNPFLDPALIQPLPLYPMQSATSAWISKQGNELMSGQYTGYYAYLDTSNQEDEFDESLHGSDDESLESQGQVTDDHLNIRENALDDIGIQGSDNDGNHSDVKKTIKLDSPWVFTMVDYPLSDKMGQASYHKHTTAVIPTLNSMEISSQNDTDTTTTTIEAAAHQYQFQYLTRRQDADFIMTLIDQRFDEWDAEQRRSFRETQDWVHVQPIPMFPEPPSSTAQARMAQRRVNMVVHKDDELELIDNWSHQRLIAGFGSDAVGHFRIKGCISEKTGLVRFLKVYRPPSMAPPKGAMDNWETALEAGIEVQDVNGVQQPLTWAYRGYLMQRADHSCFAKTDQCGDREQSKGSGDCGRRLFRNGPGILGQWTGGQSGGPFWIYRV